jgi:hypothetical protein
MQPAQKPFCLQHSSQPSGLQFHRLLKTRPKPSRKLIERINRR